MPIVETKINRFDGGIVFDPRNPRENVCRAVSNFDVLTNPWKMIPYRDSESGDSSATTQRIQHFQIAYDGTNHNLYGLGVVSTTVRAKIFQRAFTSFTDTTWAESTAGESASGTTNNNLFIYYRKVNLIFGARSGTTLWAFSPTGTAFDNAARSITYTNIAQGLVHSKDDILYIPYDNKIAKNDNGTWTDTALTLPTHLYITSISEYGDFLAIACRLLSGVGNSRVYLWDRNETTTVLSESIDWGSGMLQILEELDGELIGISLAGNNSSLFFKDIVTFRILQGNKAVKIMELNGDAGQTATELPIVKQKIDNRLYFMMMIYMADANRHGVWSIGRSSPTAPFSLINERTTDNDVAIVNADTMLNFVVVGNFTFISYQDNGVYTMSKTNDTSSFTATAIYESKIFDGTHKGYDASYHKDLHEVTVTTEPLPTAGQVVLAYRTNQTTTWTTIFTNTTDNSISRSAVASLPKDYKQIQFRIESTGNAEPTGLIFSEDIKVRKHNTA